MDAKRVPSSRLLSWEFKEARVAWGSLCPSLAASHPGFAHTVTLFVPGSWSTSGREDSKGFKFSLLKLLTSKRLEAPLAVWWLWCPRALTLEGELGGGGREGWQMPGWGHLWRASWTPSQWKTLPLPAFPPGPGAPGMAFTHSFTHFFLHSLLLELLSIYYAVSTGHTSSHSFSNSLLASVRLSTFYIQMRKVKPVKAK